MSTSLNSKLRAVFVLSAVCRPHEVLLLLTMTTAQVKYGGYSAIDVILVSVTSAIPPPLFCLHMPI